MSNSSILSLKDVHPVLLRENIIEQSEYYDPIHLFTDSANVYQMLTLS